MLEIIYQISILLLIIVLGYTLKALGLFSKKRDFVTLSTVVLYITLPSAIITNLNGLRFPPVLLLISVIGFSANWVYILLAQKLGRNKEEKGFMALNINGYNIGNFALPFIAFFLDGLPMLAISLFDAGSSIMVLGGNYAIARSLKKGDTKMDFVDILKTVIKSPTIIVYLLMVTLSLATINLPAIVLEVAQIGAGANTFLAMFYIGVILELKIDKNYILRIVKYLFIRYGTAIVFALGIHWVSFIPLEIKHALTLLFFAPVSGSAPIFTGLIDSDVELSAQVNSLTIIFSIVFMSAYLVYIGI